MRHHGRNGFQRNRPPRGVRYVHAVRHAFDRKLGAEDGDDDVDDDSTFRAPARAAVGVSS